MSLILEDINLKVVKPFIDDVGIKRPYTDYNKEEVLPGI